MLFAQPESLFLCDILLSPYVVCAAQVPEAGALPIPDGRGLASAEPFKPVEPAFRSIA
jgi:hypothetical protein